MKKRLSLFIMLLTLSLCSIQAMNNKEKLQQEDLELGTCTNLEVLAQKYAEKHIDLLDEHVFPQKLKDLEKEERITQYKKAMHSYLKKVKNPSSLGQHFDGITKRGKSSEEKASQSVKKLLAVSDLLVLHIAEEHELFKEKEAKNRGKRYIGKRCMSGVNIASCVLSAAGVLVTFVFGYMGMCAKSVAQVLILLLLQLVY